MSEVYKENLDIEKATQMSGMMELCCFWKVSLAHSLFDSYLPIITSGITCFNLQDSSYYINFIPLNF